MDIQKIKGLPTNTKILLGLAVLAVVALTYGILRTTYYSDSAMRSRQADAYEARNTRVIECEQRVTTKYYGELNTIEYRNAMRECSR